MPAARDPQTLFDSARAGDRGALGRLLSLVERGGPGARQTGRLTFPDGQADHVVGITGAPGAGKSTLTDQLIGRAKSDQKKVGVLAIDPSSPFSGGAILGDRIRMQGHALDPDVFVRSMATRGHLGGLALAAPEAIRTLASCGYRTILVETVGVGQVEVEIAGAADTTVVVVNPGWGDAVQAAKAGLLEIADVFAVNKADRPGAEEARRDLEAMLDMNMLMGDWRPPVLLCVAATGEGVDELWAAVQSHRAHVAGSGELQERRKRRLSDELDRVLLAKLQAQINRIDAADTRRALLERRIDPYEAADRLIAAADPAPPPAG